MLLASFPEGLSLVREEMKDLNKDYDKSEDNLKALQNVGMLIGEVLRALSEEHCQCRGCTIMIVG